MNGKPLWACCILVLWFIAMLACSFGYLSGTDFLADSMIGAAALFIGSNE